MPLQRDLIKVGRLILAADQKLRNRLQEACSCLVILTITCHKIKKNNYKKLKFTTSLGLQDLTFASILSLKHKIVLSSFNKLAFLIRRTFSKISQ
jgi:hypothetical protein